MSTFSSMMTVVVATTVALTFALTGCTAPASAPTPAASERDASTRGSRVCIINNSSTPMSISWRGYPDASNIPPGGQQCNSGWEESLSDVYGLLEYSPAGAAHVPLTLNVMAVNNFLMEPAFQAVFDLDQRQRGPGICGVFSQGDTQSMETGWLHGVALRLPDSPDNKEFTLTLTDSIAAPSTAKCHFNK